MLPPQSYSPYHWTNTKSKKMKWNVSVERIVSGNIIHNQHLTFLQRQRRKYTNCQMKKHFQSTRVCDALVFIDKSTWQFLLKREKLFGAAISPQVDELEETLKLQQLWNLVILSLLPLSMSRRYLTFSTYLLDSDLFSVAKVTFTVLVSGGRNSLQLFADEHNFIIK